jgi:hypothetical protein
MSKFNGTEFSTMPNGMKLYKIVLKGGPYDKHPTLCSYGVHDVYMNGERYELGPDGDYVHAPEGLN